MSIACRGVVLSLALAAGVVAACNGQPEPAGGSATLPLAPCHLGSPGLAVRIPAQCGTLAVAENPAKPDGRTIDLRVAVVPARNRDPRPDPLFVLAGGPGQAATESAGYLSTALAGVNRDRDIVLVDQRGTGSSNGLKCPDLGAEADLGELPDEERLRRVTECRDALAAQADLTQYTTPIAMDDLDAVRAALGYDKINLYGVSYGTRAALTYMRRHPGHVRAVVLDGVAPPDLPLGRDIARDAQHALDVILARCAADEACHAAYPDLGADFQRLAHQLSEAPALVRLDHPVTGEPTELELSGQTFGQAVRLLSYSPETVTLLPLLIHDAAATGDLRRFAAQALMVGEELSSSIAGGMGNTVICAEDLPFFTPDEAVDSARGTYLGATTARMLALTCGAWPRADVPADQRAPVRSDAPTLLLSGEADPVTPPANAEHALATLPNGRHLVAPGQGHGVLTRGCVPQVVEAFIEAGTAEGLDVACVDRLAAQPFFSDFTGSQP